MVDAATSIIHYKHISASLYSANSVSTISFYHVLRQISIVLSHYVEIFLILACLGCGYLLGVAEILTKAYISSDFTDAVVFGILIVVLMVKPAGIMGKYRKEKV